MTAKIYFMFIFLVFCSETRAARRNERRDRILNLLQRHLAEAEENSRAIDQSYFSRGRNATLPPIYNTWLTFDMTQHSPGRPSATTTTTTTTTSTTTTAQPVVSPYEQWYYLDDQDYEQGPFPSHVMLEWYKAGYFRSSLMLRREIDNYFSTLSHYHRLYGRIPFSHGTHPRALIRYTTQAPYSTSTTTTTITTTSTITTTTTYQTSNERTVWRPFDDDEEVTAIESIPAHPPESRPVRGDGIEAEDYHNDEDVDLEEEECPPGEDCRPSMKEGSLRLSGGRVPTEGNVEIYHMGIWGGVCDDEWDKSEAEIVCQTLGFPGAIAPTHGSRYGYSLSTIWMDNIYCYGTEKALQDCRFDGWGAHDCDRTEAAGVRCKPLPPPTTTTTTTTPRPKFPMRSVAKMADLKLTGGRVIEEGKLEIRFDNGPWGVICGDGWGVREAMVACRQLGMHYAAAAFSTNLWGGGNMSRLVSGISCKGNEENLMDCDHDQFGDVYCPGDGEEIAGVVCTDTQADLEPDMYQLMTSTHLEDKQLFLLQCAMEENCLASQAYYEQKNNPYWQMLTRRLLRFTTAISNIGTADFRPFIPKSAWEWHACHQHYHSMEVFAHFEIYDLNGNRAAEGHKASFCLEDNDCHGVDPHYDCENYGDQGITPGCKDIYYYNIDCQWIDVTDLPLGTYMFRMAINPEYKVAETTFENNAAICTLYYSQMSAVINNCTLTRP